MTVADIRSSCLKPLIILPLILLLAFPSVSIQGASDGLTLWFHVVLPSLLPFLICTQSIVALGQISFLLAPVSPAIRHVFGFGAEGAYALLCGLVCGYPVGARLCSMFLENGSISEKEAKTLLAICSQPSPMFLLGYVAATLPLQLPSLLILASVWLPVFPLFCLAAHHYGFQKDISASCAENTHASTGRPARSGQSRLDAIILSSFETMVLIGGYIMLFSILSAWVAMAPIAPAAKPLLSAVLEMTTGIHAVCQALPPKAAVPVSLAAAAFGGLSGLFQVAGVLPPQTPKNAGFAIRHRFLNPRAPLGSDYPVWKILHACLTGLTAAVLLRVLSPALLH